MTELLRVKNLCAGYDGRDVLRGVSFAVNRGEVCALLGENGSGKTTLLRAACGLLPYRGSCLLDGVEVRALSDRERARHVGWLSQRGGVPLSLSGLDVVLMGFNPLLGALEYPTKAQRQRAREVMQELGAAEFANRDFTTMSAGQKQLVLFARTLVRDAELMMLDEPDSALDLRRRRFLFDLLRRRAAEQNCGVLLCSHDVNAALRWADRLLLMRDGALCGDVDLRTASREELESALRAAFGALELIEHNGHYLMAEVEA